MSTDTPLVESMLLAASLPDGRIAKWRSPLRDKPSEIVVSGETL
jgi:hypothetical protein